MAPTGAPRNRVFRVFSRPLGAIAQLGERLVRNEEVGGSIPPGSTSPRRFAATTGKPVICTIGSADTVSRAAKTARRSPQGEVGLGFMKYVYLLESLSTPKETYVGLADDLPARLAAHNAGQSRHTSKFRPWRLVTYIAFSDEAKAAAFERYLKSSSGRAFAKNGSDEGRFAATTGKPIPAHRIAHGAVPRRGSRV
jgi:putative endonuclease